METCCAACVAYDMADPIVSCDNCGTTSEQEDLVYCDVIYCRDCHPTFCAGECDEED